MGGGRKKGNIVGDLVAGVERGGSDIVSGVGEVLTGRADEGLFQIITGSAAVQTGGLSEQVGLTTQASKDMAAEDAALQETADAETLAASQIQQKKDAIRKRLDAEIALRLKSPGRRQTLLTGANAAASGVPSLLTGTKDGR